MPGNGSDRLQRRHPRPPDATGRPVQHSWPALTCYGCGPANPSGLHLESYPTAEDDALVATFDASPDDNAGIRNVAYGGLVASLVDCNSIWTAMALRSVADGRPIDARPAVSYVTGRLTVDYHAPTPLDQPITIRSWIEGDVGRRVRVRTDLGPPDAVTATGDVTAVEYRAQQPPSDANHAH